MSFSILSQFALAFAIYHFTASKDPSYDVPFWSLEGKHVDNRGNVIFSSKLSITFQSI